MVITTISYIADHCWAEFAEGSTQKEDDEAGEDDIQ